MRDFGAFWMLRCLPVSFFSGIVVACGFGVFGGVALVCGLRGELLWFA